MLKYMGEPDYSDLMQWLNGYTEELLLLSNALPNEKKTIVVVEAQLELVDEILKYLVHKR